MKQNIKINRNYDINLYQLVYCEYGFDSNRGANNRLVTCYALPATHISPPPSFQTN